MRYMMGASHPLNAPHPYTPHPNPRPQAVPDALHDGGLGVDRQILRVRKPGARI